MSKSFARRVGALAVAAASCSAFVAVPASATGGWVVQGSPAPAGASLAQLSSVACPSTTTCIAVGLSGAMQSAPTPFAARWNGTKWATMSLPKPAGAQFWLVSSVACPSTTLCFAVGSWSGATATKPYVARWNGTTWSSAAAPAPAGASFTELSAVACAAATRCFAVGDTDANAGGGARPFIIAYNGSSWTQQTAPVLAQGAIVQMSGVACAATTACMAVGGLVTGPTSGKTFAMRYNGASWAVQTTPNPAGAAQPQLLGVSCPTATACFAVGASAFTGTSAKTIVERWNGTAWSLQPSPNPASMSVLVGVACPDATHCWAVGEAGATSSAKTLVERWNGTSWTVQMSPNPTGAVAAVLISVACPTLTRCEAVGASLQRGGTIKTLIEVGP